MANYAEIDQSGTVLRVIVVSNTDEDSLGSEAAVSGWLANDLGLGGTWKKTSYNTRKNVHAKGGQPLRKNFAGIGYKYDSVRDAFIPPKPYDSWVLN